MTIRNLITSTTQKKNCNQQTQIYHVLFICLGPLCKTYEKYLSLTNELVHEKQLNKNQRVFICSQQDFMYVNDVFLQLKISCILKSTNIYFHRILTYLILCFRTYEDICCIFHLNNIQKYAQKTILQITFKAFSLHTYMQLHLHGKF